MKIRLDHHIFTEDPYKAFAKRHDTTPALWHEMFDNRYMWHNYEIPILCEYFKLKTKMDINDRTLRRWIKRTQLYKHAQHAIKKGAREVTDTYFEQYATQTELSEMICHKEKSSQ